MTDWRATVRPGDVVEVLTEAVDDLAEHDDDKVLFRVVDLGAEAFVGYGPANGLRQGMPVPYDAVNAYTPREYEEADEFVDLVHIGEENETTRAADGLLVDDEEEA